MATILFVCTGNICRSPMAEAMLSKLLADRDIHDVRVASAGTWGEDGARPTPGAVQALAERGIELSHHESRRLTPEMVEEADLILTMTAGHRREIGSLVPAAAARTFTLREFDALLASGDAVERLEGAPAARLAAAVTEAHALRAPGSTRFPEDDVMDPLGLSLEAYRAVAWDIETLVERASDAVFGRLGRVEPMRAEDRTGGGRRTG